MSIETEIVELEDRRFQAMLDGDVETLQELLSERLMYTHSDGRVDSKDGYLATLADGGPYVSIDHPIREIVATEHVALVSGAMVATLERGSVTSRLDNATLSVWVREEGRWRYLAFQPTPRHA
jgi:hypothetical protein